MNYSMHQESKTMKKILYLTDLYYPAKGRKYYEEDLYITKILKDYFDIVLSLKCKNTTTSASCG